MSYFSSPVLLPDIPDNVSIPQFFLQNPSSLRLRNIPFFIEDRTARQVTYEQVGLLPRFHDGSKSYLLAGSSLYNQSCECSESQVEHRSVLRS